MWKLNVVAVTVVVFIIECYAIKVSRGDGLRKTLSTPGYDSASKTIRLQKCLPATEFNASKIPMLLYDVKSHPKQTQVHRYYNETRFLYISPVGVTFHGETFTCPHGTTQELFNLPGRERSKQQRYFLPNGYMRVPEDVQNVTSVSSQLVKGKACIPSENSTFPRIRRCTKAFPSFDVKVTYLSNKSKAVIKTDLLPKENVDPWDIYRDSRYPLKDDSMELPVYFHKKLACKKPTYVISNPAVMRTTAYSNMWYTDIRVTKSGKLEGRNSGSERWRPLQSIMYSDEFCIEKGYAALASGSALGSAKNGNQILKPEYQRLVLNCPPDLRSWTRFSSLSHYFILVGMLFQLATLIIYALTWNEQRVNGKIAAGFVSSMFLLFLSQYLNNVETFKLRSIGCVLNGIFQHFVTLTMYSWMAVMNYDVWQALTAVRQASQDKSTTKWILYCLITYGSAGIIVSVSSVLHFYYEIDTEKIIHPQYGFWVCYINFSVYNYYILPGTLIAFTISVCFSLLTCKTLIAWNKATKKLTKSKDSNSLDKWLLAVKVFVLTGISWGLDIAYNATHGLDHELSVGWWLTDVYNFLQVAILFWILVVKKETRNKLCKNYKLACRIFEFWDRHVAKKEPVPTTSQPTSSSSVLYHSK